MNRFASAVGAIGAGLALGGLVAYSIAPDMLWLVTLLEGLALVCLVAFFVIHFETVKAFSTRRSTRLGVNSFLMIVLFTSILVIINFLAARHSTRWDLSETQHFTLAPQTYQILRGLKQDVKVTVFAQDRSPSFNLYRDLLDSYRQANDKFKVEYVDPERRPGVARQYGITRADTAVLESGDQTTRVTTPSEAELTSALIRVSKDKKKHIQFLEGHGERSLTDSERGGLSLMKDALVKQGYETGTVSLLQESQVPENTSVLVLAGPRRPVTKDEQDRIGRFVDAGGRLLLLVDPDTHSELDPLLRRWGVELGRGVLVDLQDRLAQGDLTALMVRTFTEHEITQDFTFAVLFPVSRHLVFHDEAGKDWDFVPLARTSPRSWAETDLKGRVVSFSEKDDVQGPLPLAAAITPKKPPEEGKPRPAIVIVGNSSFASNAYINFPGNTDFLLHALGWLAEERDLISITPKERAFRPFIPNPAQERILLYVQVLLLPSLTFLWGMMIWRRRRRL
ncbi:MAG TPA: DUF4350 domain-containing protein [Nitrospiraceae bacterium]|nr:DUF4350 domain-containing protein [Nitrospiraceae bacterium]